MFFESRFFFKLSFYIIDLYTFMWSILFHTVLVFQINEFFKYFYYYHFDSPSFFTKVCEGLEEKS